MPGIIVPTLFQRHLLPWSNPIPWLGAVNEVPDGEDDKDDKDNKDGNKDEEEGSPTTEQRQESQKRS